MSGPTDGKRDEMGMVYLGLIAIAIGFLVMLWYSWHAEIAYYLLKWTWYQLALFDWSFMPPAIHQWRAEAAYLAANPGAVTFKQLLSILNKSGYLYVWIPVLLALRGIKFAITHKSNVTRRKVTVQTLPWIMSNHSPAIIPSLYYGDNKDLLLNVDPEEHRSAVNPEEWVERHGLLINGALDRSRCRELFIKDLGTPVKPYIEYCRSMVDINAIRSDEKRTFTGDELENLDRRAAAAEKKFTVEIESGDVFAGFSGVERALFAVFGARVFSDGKDIERAQELLDALNRSCHTHTWEGKKGYPDLSITDASFAKYSSHPDVRGWIAKHPYPRTLLYAMHKEALKAGKLPSSHFRWLKGMDRPLWYALNTTGRKSPFLESASVFAQVLWEEFAFDSGYRLVEPCIDDAVDGVETYLIKIGVMPARKIKE